jgi:hypothetical protein
MSNIDEFEGMDGFTVDDWQDAFETCDILEERTASNHIVEGLKNLPVQASEKGEVTNEGVPRISRPDRTWYDGTRMQSNCATNI